MPIASVVVAVIWILSTMLGANWYEISKDKSKEIIDNKEVYYEKAKENFTEENLKEGIDFVEARLDSLEKK